MILIWRSGFSSQVQMSKVGHLVYAMKKEILHPVLRKDRGINHGGYLSLPIDHINTTCLDSDN